MDSFGATPLSSILKTRSPTKKSNESPGAKAIQQMIENKQIEIEELRN